MANFHFAPGPPSKIIAWAPARPQFTEIMPRRQALYELRLGRMAQGSGLGHSLAQGSGIGQWPRDQVYIGHWPRDQVYRTLAQGSGLGH